MHILAGSFAGLALVTALFFIFRDPAPRGEIPEVPQKLETAMAVFGPPVPAAWMAAIEPAAGSAVVAAEAPPPEHRIVIKVAGSAWVEIRNAEGKAILSRILKDGDSYLVPNEPGLVMDTGNIGALEFTVDGNALAKLGEQGDVRRNVSLDPDKLKPAPKLVVVAPVAAKVLTPETQKKAPAKQVSHNSRVKKSVAAE
jgi:cytoskeleton protein RodZ